MSLLYGLRLESLSFRSKFTLWITNGSGLAREGMQHNDVMYGPVCSPSRGTPPVFFSILGVHRRADGRALGSFRLCPGRQYAMEGPCAAMQIVRRTEDLEFGGLVPVCSQYARGAARGHACRFSGGLFSWAVGRGRVLSIYASDRLSRSRRARFGLHITVELS